MRNVNNAVLKPKNADIANTILDIAFLKLIKKVSLFMQNYLNEFWNKHVRSYALWRIVSNASQNLSN